MNNFDTNLHKNYALRNKMVLFSESGTKIESETLEQLLRALDAKHISGWYHPAMRYQAELHALQGGNSELREQLRIVRYITFVDMLHILKMF